jgi:sugar transferase (PEP-CTERM/EpsH1 system associated)
MATGVEPPVPTAAGEKIRVVHVLNSFGLGGLENGVVNVINGTDAHRFDHSVCCIRQSGESARRLKRNDVRIDELNQSAGFTPTLPLRLAGLFRRLKPHVVHTRNWGAVDGIVGGRLARVPVVVHGEHGRDIGDPDGSNRKRNLLRQGLFLGVDRCVTVSAELKDWLVTTVGVPARKVHTIPNGVDIDRFKPRGGAAGRRGLGIGEDEIVVGTVGRLDPIKDYPTLLGAFSRLAARHERLRLVMVGDGPAREALTAQCRELKLEERVSFLGARDDVPELLEAMDLFVLTSLAEGASNTILEAMSTGVPVVATRVGGSPELVADGETGFLVPRRDVAGLTAAMDRYVGNPAMMRRHGEAARERIVSRYSLGGMLSNYESLYTDLVGRRVAGGRR